MASIAVNLSDTSHPDDAEKEYDDPALFPQPGSIVPSIDADSWENIPQSSPRDTPGSDMDEAAGAEVETEFQEIEAAPMQDSNHAARELRHLIKLIDEELLKRTHWRQEQQKLLSSRNWLYQSTVALKDQLAFRGIGGATYQSTEALEVELASRGAGGAKAVTSKKKKNVKSKRRSVLQEVDLAVPIGLNNSPAISSSDSSSLERTDSEQRSSSTKVTSGMTASDSIAELFDRYYKDLEAAHVQEQRVAAMNDELGNIDYRLTNKLRSLQTRLSSETMIQTLAARGHNDSHSLTDTQSSKHSGATTPTLVREYFDKVGDVGIYNERLVECIDTHEEGLIEREIFRDRGEDVLVSDEEFNEVYLERRGHIESDLRRAEQKVEELRQACEKAKLNIDSHRRKNSAYSTSRPASSLPDMEEFITPIALPQIRQGQFAVVKDKAEPTDTSRVDAWIQNLSAEEVSASNGPHPLDNGLVYADEGEQERQEVSFEDARVPEVQTGFEYTNGYVKQPSSATKPPNATDLAESTPLPHSPGFMSSMNGDGPD